MTLIETTEPLPGEGLARISSQLLKRLEAVLGWLCAALLAILLAVVLATVVLRYVFSAGFM